MMASLRLVWQLRSRGTASVCAVRSLSISNATRFADAGSGSSGNKAQDEAAQSKGGSRTTQASSAAATGSSPSSSSSSSSSSPSSTSFLDTVLSKARKQRAESQQRQQPHQPQKRAAGKHDEDELGLVGMTAGGKHRRRRRMTAAEREKRIPTFDFISDPETRKLVRDAYKYGPPAMSKLKWSLSPERYESLIRDLRPENFFRDMANEFPEVMDMLADAEAGDTEDAHGISRPPGAGDAQKPGLAALKVVESKDSELPSAQGVPPAVADILSRTIEVDTTHKGTKWFSSTTPEPCTSASSYHDPSEPASRASFPGKEENDNELGAFDVELDMPHLSLEERMRLHTDFSKELQEFEDAAPNVKYFAELCATSLSNNPFITAKQKHAFFYNLRTLVEGDFDPLSDEEQVQLWPEGFGVPNADPKV